MCGRIARLSGALWRGGVKATLVVGSWWELKLGDASVADIYPIDPLNRQKVDGFTELRRMQTSPLVLGQIVAERLVELGNARAARIGGHKPDRLWDMVKQSLQRDIVHIHQALQSGLRAIVPHICT